MAHGTQPQATISIHVLRVEDDGSLRATRRAARNFNPRPPCGGRRDVLDAILSKPAISIHVLRVEDDKMARVLPFWLSISIHVLRVEDDYARSIRPLYPR